ncbi:MAG: helix-turn-helix domain-containing protein [Candidatus Wildermuthbacteria bacterium]|nr:helix-turn-helix domain-containing protein [Candidatus Wildermuthbacteria bacterium]
MGAVNDVESRELREYMDELWKRLPEHTRRAASVKPGSHRSVEWYAQVGKFFRDAREQAGLDRYQVAKRMDVPVNHIRFLEVGVADEGELDRDFLKNYANALGESELFDTAQRRFRISTHPA